MTKVESVREIISTKAHKRTAKNVAYEFQDFGVRLAQDLSDLRRKSFYIRLSKQFKRVDLERARDYALGYEKAKSKAKIFMWFLKEMGVLGQRPESTKVS